MHIFTVSGLGSLLLNGQNITYNNQSLTYGDDPTIFYPILPDNAKYFSCKVDVSYNTNYDVAWSFTYSISGLQPEYGIGTFLTSITPYLYAGLPYEEYIDHVLSNAQGSDNIFPNDDSSDRPLPGRYMCTPQTNMSLYTPPITVLSGSSTLSFIPYNLISIVIDTTGTCGLSSEFGSGVNTAALSSNALTIRDIANNVIFYQPVSSHIIQPDQKHILRCIYSNSNQTVQVDYRNENNLEYTTIATCKLDYRILNDENIDLIAPGVSFCSPISSMIDPCTLYLYNIHHEGVSNNTETEVLTSTFVS